MSKKVKSDGSIADNDRTHDYDDKISDIEMKIILAAKRLECELTSEEVEFLKSCIESRSFEEALQILRKACDYHNDDINLDYDVLERMQKLSKGQSAFPELDISAYEFDVKFEATLVSDWSIYPEVRASTSMLDDPYEACETIRTYIIGIFYANVGSLVAVFFQNRYPYISLPFLALQLLIYPTGKALEYALPDWGVTFKGKRYTMNPGPWTYKEQMLCTQMMISVDGSPNAFNVITEQRASTMYNFSWADSWGYMILLTLTGQFMGYGVAGLLRPVLVYPVKCMWYSVLPYMTMNRALIMKEKKEKIHGWTLNRYWFFFIFMVFSFGWYWITEFVFTGLLYFNWTTWISPQNVNLASVTGVINGLGMNPISTFDWTVLSGNAMIAPWFSTAVVYVGQLLGFLVIIAIYYSHTSWTQYLPINGTGVFDNTGAAYDVSQVVNQDGTFNKEGYENYSPAFLSAGGLVNFGGQFAFYMATITYSILYYRDQIYQGVRDMWTAAWSSEGARNRYDDPFTRAMRVHPEVPAWWFMTTIIISFLLFIVMVEVYRALETPVWTIFFLAAINAVFIIPMGLFYAQTNNYYTMSFLTKIIMGFLKKHNANAIMVTEYLSNNFWYQAQNYITNQKQTHYAKMPPRALFRAQFTGTLVTVFTNIALLRWEFTGIPGYCTENQAQLFNCEGVESDYASSILWGTMGPQMYFNGKNALYPVLKWSFFIGVFLPIPLWIAEKYYKKQLRRWNILLFLTGFYSWAPSNLFYSTGNLYLGAAFNWFIRKRYLAWWTKYNYLLYAALSTGAGFAGVILFFATGYKHVVTIEWWGNWIWAGGSDYSGADYNGTPLVQLGYNQTFGPSSGNFPNAG